VEKIVINLDDTLEFPNMGPFPANAPLGYLNLYKMRYGYDISIPSMAEIFPVADQFTDGLFNGTGKFVVRIFYNSLTYPNLNPADPNPVFQSLDSGKKYQNVSVLKSVPSLYRPGLVIYYRTYDLGKLPAGRYKLASPSTISTTSDITGWVKTPPLDVNEYWSFLEGIQNSLRGTFENGAIYSPVGTIQVTNDENGHPYGYWGGMWFDKSIDHNIR
jgi:hypothetical protein